MKRSTGMIIEMFPSFEEHLSDSESPILREESLSKYDDIEQTFLKLLWFVENPEKENFNLESLYKNLHDDWLSFALECIFVFFNKDTYFMKKPTFSIVRGSGSHLDQSDFVNFLNDHKSEHGLNFSRAMLNMYIKRGNVPKEDFVIGNKKYWYEETCQEYLKSIK